MDKELLLKIVNDYRNSKEYKDILTSYKYYKGEHDILEKVRTGIGDDNTRIVLNNVPNNKIMDNQFEILVDQKKNYLLSRPVTIKSEDEKYAKLVQNFFTKRVHKMLKTVCKDSLVSSMGYLYPYVDEEGEFKVCLLDPTEIIPVFTTKYHDELKEFIRFYETVELDNTTTKHIEYYNKDGIQYFKEGDNGLEFLGSVAYFYVNDIAYSWGKVPLLIFRANEKEQPLLNKIKSLQDAINEILSKFMDDMQEDSRNTIIILKNLSGTDRGSFRKRLNDSGVISVVGDGELDTLTIEVNIENYKVVLEILRKAILDNGRGIDTKSEVFSTAPNQMTIQSMYSEIELDANDMETEFQVALEDFLYFFDIANKTSTTKAIEFIFDRDILINEQMAIQNARDSVSTISRRTIISNHPWVTDIDLEEEQIEKEQQQSMNRFIDDDVTQYEKKRDVSKYEVKDDDINE